MASRRTLDAGSEHVAAHMHIHSGQRVVHDHKVCVGIYSTRHADALLLTAAQVDALHVG